MDSKYLEKAINNTSEVLSPIIKIAYQLQPASKMDVLETANNVNKELGYDLFDDLYYTRLVNDFAVVARAVQQHALLSS